MCHKIIIAAPENNLRTSSTSTNIKLQALTLIVEKYIFDTCTVMLCFVLGMYIESQMKGAIV